MSLSSRLKRHVTDLRNGPRIAERLRFKCQRMVSLLRVLILELTSIFMHSIQHIIFTFIELIVRQPIYVFIPFFPYYLWMTMSIIETVMWIENCPM